MCPGLGAYPLFILSMFPRAVLSSEAYDAFLSCRFSWPTKAAFACLVQCSVRIAHLAVRNRTSAGNVWHTQRDFPVLCLSSGRLIEKPHFLPPNVPTPPERVPRGRAQQPMQKEPKITVCPIQKGLGSASFFGFHNLLPPRRGHDRFHCCRRETIGQLLFPPRRGSLPVGRI